jgi:hypothetical protein
MKNVRTFRAKPDQLSTAELTQHIEVAYASLSAALTTAGQFSKDYAFGSRPRYTLTLNSGETDRQRGIGRLFDARTNRSHDIRVTFGTGHDGVTLRREFFEDVPNTDCVVKVKTNSEGPLFRELMAFIKESTTSEERVLVYATA